MKNGRYLVAQNNLSRVNPFICILRAFFRINSRTDKGGR